jgi:WD40 repeat protein
MHDMRTRTLLFAILLSAFMLAASAPAVASDGRVAFMSVPEARVGTAAPGPDLMAMWSDGTHVRTLVSVDPSGAPMAIPVWSSNRLWVAYEQMKPEGPISVVRHDGARNHVIELRGHWDVAGLSAMAWSPSGRYLVAGEDNIDSENPGRWNALVMVDLRTRTPRQLVRTKTKGNRFGSLSFSPNGRYLAVGEVDKAGKPAANYLLCVSNGGTVFTYPGANVSGIDIAPDGAHISFIQGRYDPVPDHTYKELRTATLGFKQRKIIAQEGPVRGTACLRMSTAARRR